MGTMKDIHGKELTEADNIKKWQEYTEELQKKKILMTQITQIMMVTHLEPDILECDIRWALGSITTNKARGSDRIPAELIQILEDNVVKVLHSICQHIWKTQHGHRKGKGQISFQYQRKAMPKNVQIITQLCSFQRLVRQC